MLKVVMLHSMLRCHSQRVVALSAEGNLVLKLSEMNCKRVTHNVVVRRLAAKRESWLSGRRILRRTQFVFVYDMCRRMA